MAPRDWQATEINPKPTSMRGRYEAIELITATTSVGFSNIA